ncbi:MAG: hypothetical protein Q9160_003088 [Pyrenula sp. 1 TL-2023]
MVSRSGGKNDVGMPKDNMQGSERHGASLTSETEVSTFVEEIKKANKEITRELERIQKLGVEQSKAEEAFEEDLIELAEEPSEGDLLQTQEERLCRLAETTTRSFMTNYYRGTILDHELTRSIPTNLQKPNPTYWIPSTKEVRVELENNAQWARKHLAPWLAGEDQADAEQKLAAHETRTKKIIYPKHLTKNTPGMTDLPNALCQLRVKGHHHIVERMLQWAKSQKSQHQETALEHCMIARQEAMKALEAAQTLGFLPLIAKCHYWLGSTARMQAQIAEPTEQVREQAAKEFLYAFPCICYYPEGNLLDGPIRELAPIMQRLAGNEKWLPKTQSDDLWLLYRRIQSDEELWPDQWDDYPMYEVPENLSGQVYLQGLMKERQTSRSHSLWSKKSTPRQANGRMSPPPITIPDNNIMRHVTATNRYSRSSRSSWNSVAVGQGPKRLSPYNARPEAFENPENVRPQNVSPATKPARTKTTPVPKEATQISKRSRTLGESREG